MCGIFGLISKSFIDKNELKILVHHSRQERARFEWFCCT